MQGKNQGSQNSQTQQQKNQDTTYDECKKLSDEFEKNWWSTKPYMGNCGNCQKYGMIRPQDAGMFCYDC